MLISARHSMPRPLIDSLVAGKNPALEAHRERATALIISLWFLRALLMLLGNHSTHLATLYLESIALGTGSWLWKAKF